VPKSLAEESIKFYGSFVFYKIVFEGLRYSKELVVKHSRSAMMTELWGRGGVISLVTPTKRGKSLYLINTNRSVWLLNTSFSANLFTTRRACT
jgi:hypothetical protein